MTNERLHPDGKPINDAPDFIKAVAESMLCEDPDFFWENAFENQELRAREAETRVAELEEELEDETIGHETALQSFQACLEGWKEETARVAELERELAWVRSAPFTLYEDSGGCRNYSAFDVDHHLASSPPGDWQP